MSVLHNDKFHEHILEYLTEEEIRYIEKRKIDIWDYVDLGMTPEDVAKELKKSVRWNLMEEELESSIERSRN